jgi:hypothetical protein
VRLRIFDLNTPLFWLTVFFQRAYGKPWVEVSLWNPHQFKKWWVYVWQWEQRPDERGAFSPMMQDTAPEATTIP